MFFGGHLLARNTCLRGGCGAHNSAAQSWTLVSEWYEAYNSWKDGKFKELEVESMEETAGKFGKRVAKLGRELKNMPVWRSIKDIVDSFKKTMPLIVDLRNPAMRARH